MSNKLLFNHDTSKYDKAETYGPIQTEASDKTIKQMTMDNL